MRKLWFAPMTMLLTPSTSLRTLAWMGRRYVPQRMQSLRSQQIFSTLKNTISSSRLACNVSQAESTASIWNNADRTIEEIKMTNDVQLIMEAAIDSVDPTVAVRRCFTVERNVIHVREGMSNVSTAAGKSYALNQYESIVVVGIGKAAPAMAIAVLEPMFQSAFASRVCGLVLTKQGHVSETQRIFLERHDIAVREASHPIPCERGLAASNELLELVSTNNNQLVIVCVSGGGSALFCAPQSPLTLDDLKATNAALLQTGWPITLVNAVRKVLERRGKGGGLARAALGGSQSHVLSLILSDVMGDPLDRIASGPTVLPSTEARWDDVREAYELVVKNPPPVPFPPAVVKHLTEEYESSLVATASSLDDSVSSDKVDRCFNCLVGNNALAVEAAASKAVVLGYFPVILGTQLQGEAATVAQVLVGLAQHLQRYPTASHSIAAGGTFPVALIAGGETTVTLPSPDESSPGGRLGGRNQELALAAALALQEYQIRQVVVASVGTDGNDGPTDAAGAIVDGGTVRRMDSIASVSNGVVPSSSICAKSALRCHNAYPYLNQTDRTGHSPLLKTGPTGTNVADIVSILVGNPLT